MGSQLQRDLKSPGSPFQMFLKYSPDALNHLFDRWNDHPSTYLRKHLCCHTSNTSTRPSKMEIYHRKPFNHQIQLKLGNSVEIVKFSWHCEIKLKLWNSVEFLKISWNCEIQLKLWRSVETQNSVETVKFSWNCENQLKLKIQLKLWNTVKIVKFSWNCEVWSSILILILDR